MSACKFAHISDTHVRPDAIERGQVFIDHLAAIRAKGVDFVLHSGDLMDEPSAWAARAFKATMSHLQVPVYTVPGNHDVYNPHQGDIEAPWWAKLEVDSALHAQYTSWFGPSWYTFSFDGTYFVAIDSLIINSGLPEEHEQWAWLEGTLEEIAAHQPEQLFLFTHLPLFIYDPYEYLDPADFRNRYLVIAPPGRDRLLGLVRRYRVTAVFTGHVHVPWKVSHVWPEGFTTRFITTGSSGPASAMAIDQFDLPLRPDQGLGYYEHRVAEDGLSSRFHQHTPKIVDGLWELGQTWMACFPSDQTPSTQDHWAWYDMQYLPTDGDCRLPTDGDYRRAESSSLFPLVCQEGMTCYLRQSFVAEADTAAMYLELLSEGAVEIYMNGALHSTLEALCQRPPSWRSAGGTYTIDSPALALGLNQRLVRKGENVIAVSAGSGAASSSEGYIAFNRLETGQRKWDRA